MEPNALINQLFGQITSGFSGIMTDVFTIFTHLMNIMLLLVGGAIVYGIIKHETPADWVRNYREHVAERQEEGEYQGILRAERNRRRTEKLRQRARDQVDRESIMS